MNHSVDERPEQRVGAEAAEESIRQQWLTRDEIFLMVRASLDDEQAEESEQRDEIEDEAEQAGETQNACSTSGESFKDIKL